MALDREAALTLRHFNPAIRNSAAQAAVFAARAGFRVLVVCENEIAARENHRFAATHARATGGAKRIVSGLGSETIEFNSGGKVWFQSNHTLDQASRGLTLDLLLEANV